ncbi:Cocaine esterase [Polystyrenella longa]|uniref:Cocaine esterase n=1 Tax=Polystyrenella longa TaxID=2528007 RepID=A0A518CSE9_9PLAN|nr:CocE/NonD family hydrolase [Polystyrenella longa]QDU82136.1 Cocaine esterase [Polystyrenella longa]
MKYLPNYRFLSKLAFILLILTSASWIHAEDIDLGSVTEQEVMIPMRDGVKLSAFIYTPEGEGPWPVLMEQRYASFRGASTRKSMAQMAEAGYVVAGVNFRGTQQSEGRYVGYRALGWGEQQDGYDIVEWLAVQPWSNGKTGTFGSSQAGFAQNFLAVTQPPHLTCQYMIDTGLSLYHEGYRIGGLTRPTRFKGMAGACRVPEHNHDLMVEWYQHPTYDEYWQDEDCTLHFDKMNVPCFTVGSWFDYMCVGSVNSYIGRQHDGGPESRGHQSLLIGPWLHGRFNKTNKFSEVNYPENANFDVMQHMLSWFDYHLKGVHNEIPNEPVVRYYVMGAFDEDGAPGNVWRSADDWPIPTKATDYYLQRDKGLSTTKPKEAELASSLKADPFHPASIPGTAFPGARDARPFETQSEVLTFSTDVLEEPVEWTGNVQAEIYLSSDAPDTDVIVRVTDVYPDGRSILLVDMVRRARFRDGFEEEKMMKPGEVYPVKFNVGWLSQIFNKGHRIRITVASTGAPFYEPNPNTGEPLTIETPEKQFVATNQIHHNKIHASKVIAPVPGR